MITWHNQEITNSADAVVLYCMKYADCWLLPQPGVNEGFVSMIGRGGFDLTLVCGKYGDRQLSSRSSLMQMRQVLKFERRKVM